MNVFDEGLLLRAMLILEGFVVLMGGRMAGMILADAITSRFKRPPVEVALAEDVA